MSYNVRMASYSNKIKMHEKIQHEFYMVSKYIQLFEIVDVILNVFSGIY